jgi:mannose-6-phosphate isomerase-like protein (cupin superfamily)
MSTRKTIFCDIDGTLWKHNGDVTKMNEYFNYELTENTLDAIKFWDKKDYKIILTTGRKESLREGTEKSLKKLGILYDQLIMGLGNGDRILINDRKYKGTSNKAFSINVVRNKGLKYYEFDSKFTVISDDQPKEVIKPWGKEELIEYNDSYVVKKLFMKEGECCSMQYHELKRETIYVLSGKLKLYIGEDINNLEERIMTSGDTVTILPYIIHRMEGVTDSYYLESSTNELWDVVRLRDKYKRVDRREILLNSKLCFGPMSKNIVDVIINISNKYHIPVTFIPSRRQVEYDGGYVNDWTTKDFSDYIYNSSTSIAIQRDHSGPSQGKEEDDGLKSLEEDCKYLDSIHIDPFKKYQNLDEALKETIKLINYCYNLNNSIYFEVGTEEAIRKIEVEDLDLFLNKLRESLDIKIFNRILFCVIQSGTSLQDGINTGNYSKDKLKDMIKIVKKYNLFTKEHNGDFMSKEIMKSRFDNKLDSLNIAPELGIEETKIIMNVLRKERIEEVYQICYDSKKWVKWVSKEFKPEENKEKLIEITGHYIFNNLKFKEILKEENISNDYIKEKLNIYFINLIFFV